MTTSDPDITLDYVAALQWAQADVRLTLESDGAVRVALELVRFGWQTQPAPADVGEMLAWDAMGTAAQSVADDLYGDLRPLSLSVSPLVGQDFVAETRALLEAVVDRLDRAAADPAQPADQRWAWAAASGRLGTALNGSR
ncbi:hypothetical protein O7627_27395 [Solwaraspora sp. WMMD1047]|uniref:hypothetical protein n=1 Tax=Solwaraspora sp. WMMD1047 TaxID=3016102 RepID=UPI002416EB98|nr:hypothetical protein [Solwaraspora sp. WMMD1047]MDG4833002.1 hypothetical protein [Solwaraspora sp. WMMD1047]